jgi:hypothetical protein
MMTYHEDVDEKSISDLRGLKEIQKWLQKELGL